MEAQEDAQAVIEAIADERESEDSVSFLVLRIALEQELDDLPDARAWLVLVLEGESAYQAARHLGHGGKWLRKVRERCLRVIRE